MAEKVAANGGIKVEYDIQDTAANGFPDTLYMDLNTNKLKQLGWCVHSGGISLIDMYRCMIVSFDE